jgi:hypothetical protein
MTVNILPRRKLKHKKKSVRSFNSRSGPALVEKSDSLELLLLIPLPDAGM